MCYLLLPHKQVVWNAAETEKSKIRASPYISAAQNCVGVVAFLHSAHVK